jgi:hypothetical protein
MDELQHFLRLVDAQLTDPCKVVVVGGAALALGYCPELTVAEIELWRSTDDVIWTAAERASETIPRPIRVRQAMVGEPRHPFEDRVWQPPITGLKLLEVWVPEAHDQMLLKAARAESLESVTELHRVHPLTLATLEERYREAVGHVSGPRSRFRAGFLALVARLFGAAKAEQVGKHLKE